jgi:hypothetical protein
MLRTLIAILVLLSIGTAIQADDAPQPTSASAAKEFAALVEEFEQGEPARALAGKSLALAKKHPKDPVAVDALVWIAINVRRGDELSQAMSVLTKNHIKNIKLLPICQKLVRRPALASEKFLRQALEKSPHKSVQAEACFHLADYLKRQIVLMQSLKDPSDRKRLEQYYGREYTQHVVSLTEDEISKDIEQLYKRIAKSFAEVPTRDGTMGQKANLELFAIHHLFVGRIAPDIKGEDIDGKRLKLSDYRGKVVVLDFWGHW